MKAWIVGDGEWCQLIHAETRGKAKAIVAPVRASECDTGINGRLSIVFERIVHCRRCIVNPYMFEYMVGERFAERNGSYPSRREVAAAIDVLPIVNILHVDDAVDIIEKRRERRANRPMEAEEQPFSFHFIEVPEHLKIRVLQHQMEVVFFS